MSGDLRYSQEFNCVEDECRALGHLSYPGMGYCPRCGVFIGVSLEPSWQNEADHMHAEAERDNDWQERGL